ncbi:MAG: hypothetical protein AAF993_15005, partial [Pseudomonadota bacterium]
LTSYFRNLAPAQQVKTGWLFFNKRLSSLGLSKPAQRDMDDLCRHFECADTDTLYRHIGSGEISLCAALRAILEDRERTARLEFSDVDDAAFPRGFCFRIRADNRDGLLHDITQLVGDMGLALTGTTGRVSNPDSQAIITLEMRLNSWGESIKFVSYLEHISGVQEVDCGPE